MMRFRGGGIGHKSTRNATDFFKNDRDLSDLIASTAVLDSELGEEMEEPVEEIGNDSDDMNDSEAWSDSEAEDYGYNFGENSEAESDLEEEMAEEDLGPEGDGGRIDEDMVALGYSEL